MTIDAEKIRALAPPPGLPFDIQKIGHVVVRVRDAERSARFYTEVLGFEISDVYPDDMVPGGMVFMRCNADHHGVAVIGGHTPDPDASFHHMAFAVPSLDDVIRARDHLRAHGVPIDFEGRRRAGVQIAVEFRDPDGYRLEIYWGLDQVGSDGQVRPAAEWKGAGSLAAAIADPVRGQDTRVRDPALRDALAD